MKGTEMTGVELAVLCLLARRNAARYASELIYMSDGILTRPAAYVTICRMYSQGLIDKHFIDSTNQFNRKRPLYIITPKGKLKLLEFLSKLGLIYA
jgi:DNA-binding PadR family transcriptional regulator